MAKWIYFTVAAPTVVEEFEIASNNFVQAQTHITSVIGLTEGQVVGGFTIPDTSIALIDPDEEIVTGAGSDTDAIHDNISGEIVLISEKVTPANNDNILIEDSEDSNNKKRLEISNIVSSPAFQIDAAFIQVLDVDTPRHIDSFDDLVGIHRISIMVRGLSTYTNPFTITMNGVSVQTSFVLTEGISIQTFTISQGEADTIDAATSDPSQTFITVTLTSGGSNHNIIPYVTHIEAAFDVDENAIHDNRADEINQVTTKTFINENDPIILEDSQDSFNKKKNFQVASVASRWPLANDGTFNIGSRVITSLGNGNFGNLTAQDVNLETIVAKTALQIGSLWFELADTLVAGDVVIIGSIPSGGTGDDAVIKSTETNTLVANNNSIYLVSGAVSAALSITNPQLVRVVSIGSVESVDLGTGGSAGQPVYLVNNAGNIELTREAIGSLGIVGFLEIDDPGSGIYDIHFSSILANEVLVGVNNKRIVIEDFVDSPSIVRSYNDLVGSFDIAIIVPNASRISIISVGINSVLYTVGAGNLVVPTLFNGRNVLTVTVIAGNVTTWEGSSPDSLTVSVNYSIDSVSTTTVGPEVHVASSNGIQTFEDERIEVLNDTFAVGVAGDPGVITTDRFTVITTWSGTKTLEILVEGEIVETIASVAAGLQILTFTVSTSQWDTILVNATGDISPYTIREQGGATFYSSVIPLNI